MLSGHSFRVRKVITDSLCMILLSTASIITQRNTTSRKSLAKHSLQPYDAHGRISMFGAALEPLNGFLYSVLLTQFILAFVILVRSSKAV